MLPIVYGEDIIGPIISLVKVIGSYLVLRCIWCLGEIEEVVEVKLEDGTEIPGVIMTHYTGRADQQPDPYLAASIPGYTDTCTVPIGDEMFGVAYSVIRVPANSGIGFPRFVARLRGRKVRDPRGMPFFPLINGTFAGPVDRMKIAYDGTGHVYTSSPNTQAKLAAAPLANSAVGCFQMAFNPSANGDDSVLFDCGNGKLQVIWKTGNFIQVIGKNAASTTILDATSDTALARGVNHSILISWDLNANTCHIIIDGRDDTPVSYTATSGQTINLSAVGVSVGGAYSGSNLQNTTHIASVGFYTQYFNLAQGENLALFLDSQACLFEPPYVNETGAIWGPDGYMVGYTYTNTPATLSFVPSQWTIVGTSTHETYASPGYGGGWFYRNASNDAGFYLTPTIGFDPHVPHGQRVGTYFEGEVAEGVINLQATTTGTLISLDTGTVEGAVDWVPDGIGENLSLRIDDTLATSHAIRIKKLYVFPEPEEYVTNFKGVLDTGEWVVDAGSVTEYDPVTGGLESSTMGSIARCAENHFQAGEEVFYEMEVDGVFTGTASLELGGVVVCEVGEPGVCKGSGVVTTRDIRILFDKISGQVIIKRLKLETRTAAKVYTKTPSLILADLIESDAYGLGGVVDDSSLLNAARFNEFILYDNGQARHEIGLSLVERDSIISWLETLRAYARVFIVPRGDEYFLVPDCPGESVGEITASDMVANTFSPMKKSLRNLPNVVKVYYTNTSAEPWTEDFVEAVSPAVVRGDEFRRETAIRLPGIQSKSMAYRFAVERLNDSTRIDLTGGFTCFDTKWHYEVADIVTISHPVGLVNKQVRILSIDPNDRGTVSITFSEYDPDVYSDEIVDEPPPPDYAGQTPFIVPALEGLRLEETFYVSGASIRSQLSITWNAVDYAFLQYYVVEIYELQGSGIMTTRTPDSLRNITGTATNDAEAGRTRFIQSEALSAASSGMNVTTIPPGGQLLQVIRTPDNFYNFRDITMGATYEVRVYALSTAWVAGSAQSAQLVAQGYLLPPDFSNGQIVAFEATDGFSAYVRVGALDIDLWGYEFRYRELSEDNHAIEMGPHFTPANWAQDAGGDFQITDGLIRYVPSDGTTRWCRAADTGIVIGKSYDVYVKLKYWDYPLSSSAGIGIGGGGSPVTTPGTGFMWLPGDTTVAGLHKSLHPWTPSSNGNITIMSFGHTGSGRAFEIEYIAFRETAGDENIPADQEEDWNTATLIDRSTSLTCTVDNTQSGAYIVYCRALDNIRNEDHPFGQYSEDIQVAVTTVLNDDSAFFRKTFVWGNDTLTNMAVYPKPTLRGLTFTDANGGTETIGVLAPVDSHTWNATFAGTVNSRTDPVYGAFNDGLTETARSITFDLGSSISGTLIFHAKMLDLGDAVPRGSIIVEYSSSATFVGSTSIITSEGNKVKFVGRYVRVTVRATGVQIGMLNNEDAYLEVIATPRIESGTGTTFGPDGSGNPQPVTITTINAYAACLSLRAWSTTGEPVNLYCDNIALGNPSTFEVIAVDLNGQPISTAFNWEWRGV